MKVERITRRHERKTDDAVFAVFADEVERIAFGTLAKSTVDRIEVRCNHRLARALARTGTYRLRTRSISQSAQEARQRYVRDSVPSFFVEIGCKVASSEGDPPNRDRHLLTLEYARHEMAHVLSYVTVGFLSHGDDWREWAHLLGAVPKPSSPAREREEYVRASRPEGVQPYSSRTY